MSRSGREVLLGVGGGIAAYKACDLLRRLQDHGFLVTVVPTPASLNFVGTATGKRFLAVGYSARSGKMCMRCPISITQNELDYIVIAPGKRRPISLRALHMVAQMICSPTSF